MAAMDWAKTTARWDEKHLGFGVTFIRGLTVFMLCCDWYRLIVPIYIYFSMTSLALWSNPQDYGLMHHTSCETYHKNKAIMCVHFMDPPVSCESFHLCILAFSILVNSHNQQCSLSLVVTSGTIHYQFIPWAGYQTSLHTMQYIY